MTSLVGGIGVSPGSGVARTPEYKPRFIADSSAADLEKIITPDTGEIEEEDGKKILDRTGDVLEVNRPLVKGLFQDPLRWRPGPLRAEVYKLADETALESYNNLLKRAAGEDPEIVIEQTLERFYNGNFVILVKYFEVWYKSPINKK